jgi:DNA-binding transcriptional LysR family regulator
MEFAQLEFFLKVVEEGSFSKAAERVYRTQPAVSIAIRRLEEEIGVPLLDRTQKSPVLTEAGQVIHDYARRIITLRDEAREAVGDLRTFAKGRVRIGANESTSLYLLPEIIVLFSQRYPKIKVEILREVSEKLPREILDRNVDFAVMASEPTDREIETFPILKDELILIMSPAHPMATRDSVTVKELGGESFVAHSVKTASRIKVVEIFAKNRTPLNITLELATVETVKQFVRRKVGLAFVPRMCVTEELERGALATVPVRGLTYRRTLWAAYRKGTVFSHAASAFLGVLREHASEKNV